LENSPADSDLAEHELTCKSDKALSDTVSLQMEFEISPEEVNNNTMKTKLSNIEHVSDPFDIVENIADLTMEQFKETLLIEKVSKNKQNEANHSEILVEPTNTSKAFEVDSKKFNLLPKETLKKSENEPKEKMPQSPAVKTTHLSPIAGTDKKVETAGVAGQASHARSENGSPAPRDQCSLEPQEKGGARGARLRMLLLTLLPLLVLLLLLAYSTLDSSPPPAPPTNPPQQEPFAYFQIKEWP